MKLVVVGMEEIGLSNEAVPREQPVERRRPC